MRADQEHGHGDQEETEDEAKFTTDSVHDHLHRSLGDAIDLHQLDEMSHGQKLIVKVTVKGEEPKGQEVDDHAGQIDKLVDKIIKKIMQFANKMLVVNNARAAPKFQNRLDRKNDWKRRIF